MADLMQEIAEIERRVGLLGLTMAFVCKWAGLPKETWTRWKAGGRDPQKSKWDAIVDAVADLERRLAR